MRGIDFMKNIFLKIFLVAATVCMTANPASADGTRVIAASGVIDKTSYDPFDQTDEWFNKKDSNGDINNPDVLGFEPEEFAQMGISGLFDRDNVPWYTVHKVVEWEKGNADEAEYIWENPPKTKGKGFTISKVKYYKYIGSNPCYGATTSLYNTELSQTEKGNPKLSRFIFYRFTGKGGGIAKLDNYLIAIDTYSKMIFAFSEPGKFTIVGAPTQWLAADRNKYGAGENAARYMFYEFDPVGYITKNGDSYEITLYQWFKDNQAKGDFRPKIKGYANVASKTPDGYGKSPFLVERSNIVNAYTYTDWLSRVKDGPFYASEKNTFAFSDEGKTLTMNDKQYTFYAEESQNNRAVYIRDIAGVVWYYGVELSNDNARIKITTGGAEKAIHWGLLGSDAYLSESF